MLRELHRLKKYPVLLCGGDAENTFAPASVQKAERITRACAEHFDQMSGFLPFQQIGGLPLFRRQKECSHERLSGGNVV
ncbi:hypothetical protein DSM19430T_01920 [Desulfovibrio psychrotolerans]|uniref:Uncharacterized protein n=1 Tax=Desulfovibrio psychrotolerans TaxID=415242 RepID=A0A7J0BPG8_9BACT|nr:hypothetical protein DSM19430T_01920 [Desulfovibrio psychrotolerans]